MVSNWTISPSELNQKCFFLFFRVTYSTGRDWRVPLSLFFGIVRYFFENCFSSKGPRSIFLILGDRKDVEKSQRVPPFNFFGIVRLFRKKIPKGSPSTFWCFATMDVKKCKRVPRRANSVQLLRFLGTVKENTLALSFWYFWALDMAPTYAVPSLFVFTEGGVLLYILESEILYKNFRVTRKLLQKICSWVRKTRSPSIARQIFSACFWSIGSFFFIIHTFSKTLFYYILMTTHKCI